MLRKIYDWRTQQGKFHETAQSDFDRNREGIYGGLPQARPDEKVNLEETATADFNRNRDGIYGGLPKARLDH